MSYKSFGEYWRKNKEILEENGVSKLAASKIWGDAVNALSLKLIKNKLNM